MRNRIKQILQDNGWEDVRPSQELLDKLGVTLIMWNKWLDNSVGDKKQPNATQLMMLKNYLNVDSIEEIIDVEAVPSLAKKHGFQ